ncbi:MAG: hypothetical protein J0H78_20825 [Rhizobiales bacterium]|nr:hypothetical protein [Hyphomicrobiales bacterium]
MARSVIGTAPIPAMSYKKIDPDIVDWSNRNRLTLFTSAASGEECRVVYMSSKSGSCYQISIDPPHLDSTRVYIFIIEGPGHDSFDPLKVIDTSVVDLPKSLDLALQHVLALMAPSERYIPSRFSVWVERMRNILKAAFTS